MLIDYAQNFVENTDQFVALGSVALLWLGMMAIGGAIKGSARLAEIDHLIGWSVLSLIFTTFAVFTPITFQYMAIVAGVVAVGSLFVLFRSGQGIGTGAMARILLLSIPLLLLAAAIKGSQWDEFGTWLLIPRYMLESHALPSVSNPYTTAFATGYPFSWHYITYLPSLIAGRLLESAGALSNVFLLLAAAALLIRLIGRAIGDPDLHRHPAWAVSAFATLAMTLINPTFAQKVAMTAYADTSSAVVTGTAVIVAWFCIEALVDKEEKTARGYAISLGLLLLLLVNLKQATVVLALLVAGGLFIVALRDPAVRFVSALKLAAYIIVPPVIIFLVWRYQLSAGGGSARELAITPFDQWLIHLIPQILAKMGLILTKKGYYLVLFLVLIGVGLRGFWRSKTPFDRFAALSMGVVLGYNSFLLFAYVTTFGQSDALRGASYWRYSMHLGMVIVAFSVYGLATLWQGGFFGKFQISRLKWLVLFLVLAAPFVFAKKLRFDREPMTVHYRQVGAEISTLLRPDDRVFDADPTGSGESASILGYELRSGAKYVGFVGAFHGDRLKPVQDAAVNTDITAMIVYTQLPEYQELFTEDLQPRTSYLFKRDTHQEWQVVKTWPHPR
jgi:hypothetical protein